MQILADNYLVSPSKALSVCLPLIENEGLVYKVEQK